MEIFHGGCVGCTAQDEHGVTYCVGCQYFDGEWELPNLSTSYKRGNDRKEEIRRLARRESRDMMELKKRLLKGINGFF